MPRRRALPFLLLLCAAVSAAPPDASVVPRAPATHVLIIAGQPGTPVHARRYRDWVKRFHNYLTTRAAVSADRITILSGDAEFADPIVSGRAGCASIDARVAESATTVDPDDQFILVLLGHGSTPGRKPKLVLPGRDLDLRALAKALDAIPATNQVVVNATAAAGSSIADFARVDRVVVSANNPLENAEPVFFEFFLRGLETGRADGEGAPDAGKADGQITLLEAFNWAARETPSWIRRIKKGQGENTWRVTGRDAVETFRKLYGAPDGTPGARRLAPGSEADIDDPDVPFTTPRERARELAGVRIIPEHAMLEDSGEEIGVSPIGAGRFEALSGRVAGEPGALARRVVLGQAGFLPEWSPSTADGSK